MSEDKDKKVLPFRPGQQLPRATDTTLLAPLSGKSKLGVFPLGPTDVLMSLDLLNTIISILEHASTAEDRRILARQLRDNYEAPFI